MKNKLNNTTIEIMSDEFADYLDSLNLDRIIEVKFGVESKQFREQRQKTVALHKKWSDMCLSKLNKISGKKRKWNYEAIADVAKCDPIDACVYSPQQIEALFNKL